MSTVETTNLKNPSSATNNIVLNADGSVGGDLATTLASKLDVSGGKVLQVVSGTYSVLTTSTSTSWVTGGFSVSITPTSASNKVLVIYSGMGYHVGANNNGNYTIFRGDVSTGTNLGNATEGLQSIYIAASPYGYDSNISMSLLDSPATTSAQTYTPAMKARSGMTISAQNRATTSSLILMEISA